MLHYRIVENHLTTSPNSHMARVTKVNSYSSDDIADLMLQRGSLITKTDILAVLNAYQEVIADLISDGEAVNTELFQAYPAISGVFNGMDDSFDDSRHQVNINLNPGKLLRKAIKRVKTEKTHIGDPVPTILEVKDIVTGNINNILTPGGVIQVSGNRLKFFQEIVDNGIYLLSESNTAIQLNLIIENMPSRIIAVLPADLPKGSYTLEIRSSFSRGNTTQLKQLKTSQYTKVLHVY